MLILSRKGLGFFYLMLLPFPCYLGRDVRGDCSTKTMGIGNKMGNESVLGKVLKQWG